MRVPLQGACPLYWLKKRKPEKETQNKPLVAWLIEKSCFRSAFVKLLEIGVTFIAHLISSQQIDANLIVG